MEVVDNIITYSFLQCVHGVSVAGGPQFLSLMPSGKSMYSILVGN